MGDITNIEFTLERAESALISRDFALASRLYKSVLKDQPDNKDVLLKLGACYIRANQDEKAIEPYKKVLELENDNFDALNNLGGVFRRLGRYEDSVKVLEAALKLGKNIVDVNYNLGFTYKLLGHYDAATESFYSVIEENPNDVLAYNHLGSIQAARGEHRKALQTYWRALQIDPNHPILHFNTAQSFFALGKYDDAIGSYESALRSKPGWTEAVEGYAKVLIKQNNYKKAEEVLNTAIHVNPTNPDLINLKGKLFFKKGWLAESEEEYKKTLAMDEENYNSLKGLTSIYEILGRYPEASVLLKKLEKIASNKDEIVYRQISLLLFQNKLKEAAELLKLVREKDPENVQVLNLLAQFFIRSRQRKKELGCYKLIKDLDPNYIVYMRDCGEQHSKIGNYDKAKELISKYLELSPSDTKALALFGFIAEINEDYDTALKAYQSVLKLEPENRLILGAISKIGQETGPNSEAMEIITDILNENTESISGNLINDSVKAYEDVVKNLDSTPVEISEEDLLGSDNSMEEISLGIEDIPEVELDDLFTYDMNEALDFSELDDEVITIDEIEDEPQSRRELDNLLADDLPLDYAPTEKETGYYNPFDGASNGDYDVSEDDSVVDVHGRGALEDDENDLSLDEPFEDMEESEIQLENEVPTVQNPVQMPYPVQIPYPVQMMQPVSNPIENATIQSDKMEVKAENLDLTYDVEPEDLGTVEEEISYNDLLPDPEPEVDQEPMVVNMVDTEPLEIEPETDFEEDELEDEIEDFGDPIAEFENGNIEETENILEDSDLDFDNPIFDELEEDPFLEKLEQMEKEENLENQAEYEEPIKEEKSQEDFPYQEAAQMFKILRELSDFLDEDVQKEFSTSLEKLRLDYVIEKLSGKSGLLEIASAVRKVCTDVTEDTDKPLEVNSLYDTIEYLQSLTAFLPNQQQATALERETAKILEKL